MQRLGLSDILQKKFIGANELRRELTEILATLRKKGGEVVVTQHGKPQAILLDVDSYLELQEQIADLDPQLVKRVNKALAEAKAGKGIPAEQVFKQLDI